MQYALWIILGYLLVLAGLNFWRSRKVKSQEDFMLAGRKLSLTVIVFTLICTWIGSGTFIAGAEYAAKAGWSSLWLPAGAWVGIAVIYFLAAKIRSFGQYTIGDILEVRYGKFARVFGAVCIVIAFTTIVSYQFRAGGYILNLATDGALSLEQGQAIAAGFVILFTAMGGMVAVANTDLPNGIIIVLACCAALPFTVLGAGGWEQAHAALPAGHVAAFDPSFGEYPVLKALAYCLSTMLLLMGVQSMYQKFYAAKSPREARRGAAIWIVGTIVVETVVVAIAIFAASRHWVEIQEFETVGAVQADVATDKLPFDQAPQKLEALVAERVANGKLSGEQAQVLGTRLAGDVGRCFERRDEACFLGVQAGVDPRSIVLVAARDTVNRGGLGFFFGLLLLAAACAVVLSTGMNYLLSPSTNIIRDILGVGRTEGEDPKRSVALQKIFVVIIGLCAFAAIFIPTALHLDISVLKYSYFAYTMYGVSITPALLAALTWKRATPFGGTLSIVVGAVTVLALDMILPRLAPQIMVGEDPWGIPSVYPALVLSVGSLVVGSLLTPPPSRERLAKMFPETKPQEPPAPAAAKS
jgi:solute:Na+ symporter, SSS family